MNDRPKTILWLGSSLGNFKRHEVPPFLSGFHSAMKPGDTMLIGVDSCKDGDKVFHAYNDRDNVTRDFTLNGLKHANRIMGDTVFHPNDWEAVGEYDVENGCHRACVSPLKDVEITGVKIVKGERIKIEESHKYSRVETERLWEESGLVENTVWSTSTADYGRHHSPGLKKADSNALQDCTLSRSLPSSSLPVQRLMQQSRFLIYLRGVNFGPRGMQSRRI
jgi:uncharacterized SAM-dependent methyltransferase